MNHWNTEKRSHPRVQDNIPLRINLEDEDVVTETLNISCSGVYCRCNKPIGLMTKLKICLLLPIRKSGKSVTKKVACEGVVVRMDEDAGARQYYLAIFFSDLSRRNKDNIADYVSSHQEGTLPRLN